MTSGSRGTVAVFALLILCQASRPAEAALWRQQREQPSFTAVPARIAAKGQGSLTELKAQAAGETRYQGRQAVYHLHGIPFQCRHNVSLSRALRNEELVLTKQNEVLSNLASLDEEEAARAQTASSRWQEAQEQASDLLVQQQQYQQVQQQLLGDLRQLSDSSAGLRTALDVVVQLPLMMLFALSVVAERAMMHSMHHLLEIDHTGQVGLSLPVFGIPINLKNMVRRLCLATAVAQVMWAAYKHSDLEQETIRACRKLEAQQQKQLHTPSRGRHVSHNTNAGEKITTQAEKSDYPSSVFYRRRLPCCTYLNSHRSELQAFEFVRHQQLCDSSKTQSRTHSADPPLRPQDCHSSFAALFISGSTQ
ncbi:hypothetical protein WJX79_006324 [Trebouxia sp. C0005]